MLTRTWYTIQMPYKETASVTATALLCSVCLLLDILDWTLGGVASKLRLQIPIKATVAALSAGLLQYQSRKLFLRQCSSRKISL